MLIIIFIFLKSSTWSAHRQKKPGSYTSISCILSKQFQYITTSITWDKKIHLLLHTRVGTLIVATIYLQLIQN